MKIDDITKIRTDELPLDNLLENGGYTNIFPTIACIGDSLSSGEFEYVDPNNNRFFIDKFEFSWGQYIAKMTGNKVYNFSRGGMSAKEYMESFGQNNNLFSQEAIETTEKTTRIYFRINFSHALFSGLELKFPVKVKYK